MQQQHSSRPQSGQDNELDWLQPTSAHDLSMDQAMLFGSFKDSFAQDNTADTLFEESLQLPMPGMALPDTKEETTTDAADVFVNPADYFNPLVAQKQDEDSFALKLPAEGNDTMQNDSEKQQQKLELPQLSIDTDNLQKPAEVATHMVIPLAQVPVVGPMTGQPTPAWVDMNTPYSSMPSGLMTGHVMTPQSTTGANQNTDPLQLGPGWTETVQMANLVAADGSGQMFSDISARIDRGFFLAENDWVCYRRNYFQVSSTFSVSYQAHPNSRVTRASEVCVEVDGVQLPVRQFIIQLSSKNSHSDKKIELVQHTAKRDKGPQSIPCRKSIQPGGDITSAAMSLATIATYERLQFRTATANNGKRRAHQQYYSLYLELVAQLNTGEEVLVAKCESAPLVVRGRSPGHYAAHEKAARQRNELREHHEQEMSPIMSGVPQTPMTGFMPMDHWMSATSPYSPQQAPASAFPNSAALMMNDLSLMSAQPQMVFNLDKQLQQMQEPDFGNADGLFNLNMIAPEMAHNTDRST